jgi:hypothetical protein
MNLETKKYLKGIACLGALADRPAEAYNEIDKIAVGYNCLAIRVRWIPKKNCRSLSRVLLEILCRDFIKR